MKFIFISTRRKNRRAPGILEFNFEKMFILVFVVAFFCMLVIQGIRVSPEIVQSFAYDQEEALAVFAEEWYEERGQLVLEFANGGTDPNIKVLVNGCEVADFSTSVLNLAVEDGDVVEIDGTDIQYEAQIDLISKSSNIHSKDQNKSVSVFSNIEKLLVVTID